MRLALAVVVAGCGRLGFDPIARSVDAGCVLGSFGAPVAIANVQSGSDEFGPWLSEDRRELYFNSQRTGPNRIYHAHRDDPAGPFGAPIVVPPVGSSPDDPFITDDGLTMFYDDAPGAIATFDLKVATRSTPGGDFGAGALIAELNTSQFDGGPTLSSDTLTMLFTTRRINGVDSDLFVATRPTAMDAFGAPTAAVATAQDDCCASLSGDGQRAVFSQGPFASHQLKQATLAGGVLVDIAPLDPALDGDKDDVDVYLSRDEKTIVFSSDRSGGAGKHDLYIAERACQ